nr:ABC transporter ATP-binding protein [Rhodococcus sp. (in: high G+C Gram-positive bacteria)]
MFGKSRPKRTGSVIVRRALRRNSRTLAAGTALNGCYQIAEAMVPVMIGVVVDRAVSTGSVNSLLVTLLGLAAVFVVITVGWRHGARLIEASVLQEAHLLRVETVAKVLHPGGIRTDLRSGEVLTVSTSDADQAAVSLEIVPWVVGALVATTTAAISLLVIDIPLGLAVLVGTPIILVVLQTTGPLIARKVEAAQASTAKASGMATDLVSGIRPLRGVGAEHAASDRYRVVSRKALSDTLRVAKVMGIYQTGSTMISALLAVAVAGGAGWLALRGDITIGELIAVVGLSQFIIEPLGSLALAPKTLAMARGSADRLALVLGADVLVESGTEQVSALPSVSLRGIEHRSLKNFDLEIAPGELVGVVSYSPQDSDALVDIVSGQISPTEYRGQLLLDGVPVEDIDLASARAAVLVEPHRHDLFAGTVGTNVGVGVAEGREAVLEHALKHSASDDVVAANPAGLEHTVTDRGASLSGGQRQRLALARALAAEPPVLVLHDPTTAVDAVTEHAIAEGIAVLRHGRTDTEGEHRHTTIIVTSSPSLLSVVDRVVVLDGGTVVAEGKHEDFARNDERYRDAVVR